MDFLLSKEKDIDKVMRKYYRFPDITSNGEYDWSLMLCESCTRGRGLTDKERKELT